ncbi:MAG TPA: hypothetical protein VN764_18345, partial [Polyangiaceae bacterium]|nr:hypothetical protein [Polyangiaceae bacterium]
GLAAAKEWTRGAIMGAPTNAQKTMELGKEFAVELAEIMKDHGPSLVKKGMDEARARVMKLPLASQVQSLFEKAS